MSANQLTHTLFWQNFHFLRLIFQKRICFAELLDAGLSLIDPMAHRWPCLFLCSYVFINVHICSFLFIGCSYDIHCTAFGTRKLIYSQLSNIFRQTSLWVLPYIFHTFPTFLLKIICFQFIYFFLSNRHILVPKYVFSICLIILFWDSFLRFHWTNVLFEWFKRKI